MAPLAAPDDPDLTVGQSDAMRDIMFRRIEAAGGAAQVPGMKPGRLRSRMLKLGVPRP